MNDYIDYDLFGYVVENKPLNNTYNEIIIENTILDDIFRIIKSYSTKYSKRRELYEKLKNVYFSK